MSSIFTPMKASGTVVLLQGEQLGGFDLHGCPAPEALAKFIADSCNEIAVLRMELAQERGRLNWLAENCMHTSDRGWHAELGNDYPLGQPGDTVREAIDREISK